MGHSYDPSDAWVKVPTEREGSARLGVCYRCARLLATGDADVVMSRDLYTEGTRLICQHVKAAEAESRPPEPYTAPRGGFRTLESVRVTFDGETFDVPAGTLCKSGGTTRDTLARQSGRILVQIEAEPGRPFLSVRIPLDALEYVGP